jgi:hypothetical protein
MIADKDYFLDKDRLLTDDEANAAFLLVRKGQEVSKDVAELYGLGKVAPAGDEAQTVKDEEEKPKPAAKSKTPAENKSKTPASVKGKE